MVAAIEVYRLDALQPRSTDRCEIKGVTASADCVLAGTTVESIIAVVVEDVIAVSRIEDILTAAPRQNVVASSATKDVVAFATEESIRPAIRYQVVIVSAAVERIPSGAALENVISPGSGQTLCVRVIGAVEVIVAGVSCEHDRIVGDVRVGEVTKSDGTPCCTTGEEEFLDAIEGCGEVGAGDDHIAVDRCHLDFAELRIGQHESHEIEVIAAVDRVIPVAD